MGSASDDYEQQALQPRTVFFKNMPMDFGPERLSQSAARFGKVEKVDLWINGNGRSKGMGKVTFTTEEAAREAVVGFNDMTFDGTRVFARIFTKHMRTGRGQRGGRNRSRISRQVDNHDNTVVFKNVPYKVSEEALTELFAEYGQLTHFKLFTHEGNLSRGFGNMRYASREDALDAVKSLCGYEIGGRIMTVELMEHSKAPIPVQNNRLSQKKLCFSNVLYEMDENRLKGLFATEGTIMDFHLERTSTGKSRGCGEVEYVTTAEADNAILKLDGHCIGGRRLKLRRRPENEVSADDSLMRATPSSSGPTRVVFKNVQRDTPPEFICGLFMKYGHISRFQLRKSESGVWLGAGVVEFGAPAEAQMAKDNLNGAEVDGSVIVVEWDAQDPNLQSDERVGFSNVPLSTPPSFVRDIFEEFGRLIDFSPWTTSTGKFRGLGTVAYEEAEDAQAAVQGLNGVIVDDQRMVVTPKIPVEFCTNAAKKESTEESVVPPDDVHRRDARALSPDGPAPCKRKSPIGRRMSGGDDDMEKKSFDRIGTKDEIEFPAEENCSAPGVAEIKKEGSPGDFGDRGSPKSFKSDHGGLREPGDLESKFSSDKAISSNPGPWPCDIIKAEHMTYSSSEAASPVSRKAKTARVVDDESIVWEDL